MARVKSFLYPVSFGVSHGDDANSCVLRAYAYLTETSFEDVQKLFLKLGRKKNEAVLGMVTHELMLKQGFQCMGLFGKGELQNNYEFWCNMHNEEKHKGMTLKTFCNKFNKGKFAVAINGHMTVVDNGKIVDYNVQRGNAAVITAYRKPE